MRARSALRLLLCVGTAYALWLQTLLPGEVFLTGDGGLKALLVHQFASGDLHVDLRLPGPAWSQELWDDGLFPFQEPYVYRRQERRFVRFPFPFPLVTAPFYRAFGFRGLHVLPLLAVLLTWATFLRLGRSLRLSPLGRATGLGLLIFASPLTFYGATFWEHTPSVALAFVGAGLVLARPFGRAPSFGAAVTGGLLVGLAAGLREEQLLLGACVALVLATRARGLAVAAAFGAGLAAGFLPLLAVNALTYGHPLGVHHLHAAETLRRADWTEAVGSLWRSASDLVACFPAALLCLGLMFLPARRPGAGASRQLLLAALGFVCLLPLLIQVRGKDFGPRFLLGAVPLLALAAAVSFDRLRRARDARVRWATLLAVAVAAAMGFTADTLDGASQLRASYARRDVPYRALVARPERVVAVSHEFAAQGLAGAFPGRLFFRVARAYDLRRLARVAAEHGETGFLYVCDPAYRCPQLGDDVRELSFPNAAGQPWLTLRTLGSFDRYIFYEARVQSATAQEPPRP